MVGVLGIMARVGVAVAGTAIVVEAEGTRGKWIGSVCRVNLACRGCAPTRPGIEGGWEVGSGVVGLGVSWGVGLEVGLGVGWGVGLGVGLEVGSGVGLGVSWGVGLEVGLAVSLGVASVKKRFELIA